MNNVDGGPAFGSMGKLQKHEYGRRSESVSYVPEGGQEGMSLRDYFAAKALPVCMAFGAELAKRHGQTLNPAEYKEVLCGDAYAWADAMLAAREGSAK